MEVQKTLTRQRHVDLCYNPFNLSHHNKKQGLRHPSEQILKNWPSLLQSDLLCSSWRKRIVNLAEPTILAVPEDLSTDDTSPLCSQTSDLSIETKLPIVNDALRLIGQSPIPQKKLKCTSKEWVEIKVNAIAGTFRQSLGTEPGTSGSQNDAWNASEMIVKLKQKYHAPETDKNLKIQILTLMPEEWSIAKVSREMDTTLYMARTARRLLREKGVLATLDRTRDNTSRRSLELKVAEFYEDDEMSAMMPGMKDFISVRNEDGTRSHRQKRLILSNLKELHLVFKQKNPEIKIGFSIFASLRPKHCVLAGSSGTHTVCVCSIHQNVKLMMQGCDLQNLTKDSNHHLVSYEDCLALLVCSVSDPKCCLGTCRDCPGIDMLLTLIIKGLDDHDIENIKYRQWVSKPRTTLETFLKSSIEFAEDFCSQVKTLLPHSFIAKKQSAFIKSLKSSLRLGECLIMCDFAENYAFIVQNAAPGFHWNNNQATLYPVVGYYKTATIIEHKSMVIISDCMHHDSIAVYVFSRVINEFIPTFINNISRVYYCSDGAPQQFKNYKHFSNLYYHREDFGTPAEWHFTATAHGKGPCDGIGGTVKRLAARSSLQLPAEMQITTPRELFEWANQLSNLPGITIRYTDTTDYNNAAEFLRDRFSNARSIPRTQKHHCIIPNDNGTVMAKRYSTVVKYETFPILK